MAEERSRRGEEGQLTANDVLRRFWRLCGKEKRPKGGTFGRPMIGREVRPFSLVLYTRTSSAGQ